MENLLNMYQQQVKNLEEKAELQEKIIENLRSQIKDYKNLVEKINQLIKNK